MERLNDLVIRARTGDLEAFGQLVAATQAMAYAAANRVLRDSGGAQDAAQEAYLRGSADSISSTSRRDSSAGCWLGVCSTRRS